MGRTTLRRILSTETYVGDLLLQRYFSPEIHKPKLNEGEMEQILVSNAHEPLVSREDYAKVQERLNRGQGQHTTTDMKRLSLPDL